MKNILTGLFLSLLFFISVNNVLAQTTNITGKVTDALTNEPVPFATVILKGSTIGANTDFNGSFQIITATPSDSILCTMLGYKPVMLRVRKGQVQTINFALHANKFELGEVVVKAGENPANIILRNIIKHKDENDASRLETYQYEVYNKLEFDLTNISDKMKNRKLLKPFAFIWDNMDSTESNSKPFLPFFISETMSDIYYRSSPKTKKEIIAGSKVSGLENSTVTQFLGDMYQRINVYDNFINMFGKGFISPISDFGLLYYKYYLLDSATIDNQWCYKLKFKPRSLHELTFTGDFWVHDTTFAIKKINMRIAGDANINWIEDLAIVQEYYRANNTQWMLSKDMLVIDFAAKQDGMGFIGRKTTSYKKFKFNEPIDDKFFKGSENIIVNEDAVNQSNEYWNGSRHDSLAERERKIYHLVDTIKTLPAFKTYIDLITLFFTGYKEIGYFEFGPYYSVYSFNQIEGNRFRIGGQTSDIFSLRTTINAYVAYGTRDNHWKYSGGIKYLLTKKPRQFIGGSYKMDVQQLGQSDNAFTDDNILSSLFRRSAANKLSKVENQKAYYEMEWIPGFSNRITVSHTELSPASQVLDYSFFKDKDHHDTLNTINSTEISLYTRFLYREKYVYGKKRRVSIGSAYPTFQINYTLGIKGVLHSDLYYHKLTLKIDDTYKLNPFGYTYYVIQAGKTWGNIPYPLLEAHPGNESYFYDYAAFNLMNYFEFVSDKYLSVYATHHFDGFFLNKIPLMRRLKWREIVQFKAVVGGLSSANDSILVNPNAFEILKLNKPYAEAGVGVENIFKIFRVDFIWRLNYIGNDYKTKYVERYQKGDPTIKVKAPAQFGIRASLQFVF